MLSILPSNNSAIGGIDIRKQLSDLENPKILRRLNE